MSIQEKIDKETIKQSIIENNEKCSKIEHELKVLCNEQGRAFNDLLYVIRRIHNNKSWIKYQINEALFYRYNSILHEHNSSLNNLKIKMHKIKKMIREDDIIRYPDLLNRSETLDNRIIKCFKLIESIQEEVLKRYKKIDCLIHSYMEREKCKEEEKIK